MFKNRIEAGQKLAQELQDYQGKNCLVLAIPRGGVIVGREVSRLLGCPLDVVSVKKIGAPAEPELAIGAVGTEPGSVYKNIALIKELAVDKEYLAHEIEEKRLEALRREKELRGGKGEMAIKDKVVIIVDDGAATGATLKAAVKEVWDKQPNKIVIALPLAAEEIKKELEEIVDEVVVLETPAPFFAVGQGYEEFEPVTDEEMVRILKQNHFGL